MRIVLLVLMLAVSHVTLMSHATAHFTPNLEQCELCVSQAQMQAAIPSPDHSIPVDSEFVGQRIAPAQNPIPARPFNSFRQRAPPVSFS